jgi:hypothetical protein
VGRNKKGEPLIAVAGAGCGRTLRLRESKVILCHGYSCGFGGHGVSKRVRLPKLGWVKCRFTRVNVQHALHCNACTGATHLIP